MQELQTCISCGHDNVLSADEILRCGVCGGSVPVREGGRGAHHDTVRYHTVIPTLVRRGALVLGLLSGIICVVMAGVIMMAGAAYGGVTPESALFAGGKLVALAAGYGVLGLIYITCAANIGVGSRVAAWVVIVLGGAHEAYMSYIREWLTKQIYQKVLDETYRLPAMLSANTVFLAVMGGFIVLSAVSLSFKKRH